MINKMKDLKEHIIKKVKYLEERQMEALKENDYEVAGIIQNIIDELLIYGEYKE